jgi:prolyl-tRNA synthetase
MLASKWFISTLKETPSEATIVSHKLMLRAGLIRKLGSGLYSWLPTGLKVLRKIEKVIREEMNNVGALEILMPSVQPAELWQETNRWDTFGNQLLVMRDSNKRDYCFGPTHEEVITDLVRHEIQSYKQLPINFYQIQTKFRDEIRPRFGVMRAREFIMKDAYSFHLNLESLQTTYNDMYQAYCKIFDRLKLNYRAVEADTGAIGGSTSHEFQILADAGEDLIFYSDTGTYAANSELANYKYPNIVDNNSTNKMEKIATVGMKTIKKVSKFLNKPECESVKTLIVKGAQNNSLVALVLRGDDELNETKAIKHPLVQNPFCFANEADVQKALNVSFGSIGPVNLNIPMVVDYNARALVDFVCGANEDDMHYINVNWGRDVTCDDIFDLRTVKVGDTSPDGIGKLLACRGIEAGHIFQLGDKYAKAMNANVTNEEHQLQTLQMGCYGIGVSRIVGAAIEQFHDDKGICWPESIAPFQLVIIPINYARNEQVKTVANNLYNLCISLNIDVLLDDRQERPGVLFADNDLIGVPHRIVISDKLLENNQIEYKSRINENPNYIVQEDIQSFLLNTLNKNH